MLFRQSAVSAVTHDTVVESAGRLPTGIYPAMIGSGEIGLGLDATGLQGLNTRTRQFRDTCSLMYDRTSTQDDLYIRRDAAVSKHEVHNEPLWNPATNFVLLPCGWLDYTLSLDGQFYDSARLAAEATAWQRTFSPRTGIVETRFRLGEVQVVWQAGIAPGRVEADFLCAVAALDGKSHRLELTIRCHLTTRAGKPLATGGLETDCSSAFVFRAWNASSATSTAPLLDPIRITWALAGHGPAVCSAAPEQLAIRFVSTGASLSHACRLITGSDRNGTATREFAAARAAAFRAQPPPAALAEIAGEWRGYFERGAEVRLGDPMKEFLFLQSQYHLRAGAGWHNGVPMSTLWTQAITPANYWDSFFAADGMLRCGHFDEVRQLCRWLLRTAAPSGRPHYWMTYHNGVPVETNDQAYQVVLAFSGIFIRLCEASGDSGDLKELAYPYLRRVAEYAFQDVLVQDSAGWRLRGAVAHDVDTAAQVAEEQPGMLLWVAVCIAKCAEYAAKVGADDALVRRCREVDAWFRAHPINLTNPGMWDLWLPMLTCAEPLADFESWWRTAERVLAATPTSFFTFPWGNFATAISLSQTGHPDLAFAVQNEGLQSISGQGCIDEICYEAHGGGWAPFPTATGPWLSSVLIALAHGSLWNDEVLVAVHLPRRLACQSIEWRGATTFNGARVSGSYDPQHLEVTIESTRARPVRLRLPFRIAGEPVEVRRDGQTVAAREEGETVLVDLPAGTHRFTIERDLAAPADVVVAEPFDQGRLLVELVRRTGCQVRWARDFDSLPLVARKAKALLLPVSYVTVPPDTVEQLAAAVRDGLVLITLFHSGCLNLDRALAELTGVRAVFDGTEREYWGTASRECSWSLTDTGRACLSGLAAQFRLPVAGRWRPNLADGVKTLAVDSETGRAVVTWRPVGRGQVFWLATGSRVMDIGIIDKVGGSTKNLWTFGRDIQEDADLKWLRDENTRKLLQAVITAGLSGKRP